MHVEQITRELLSDEKFKKDLIEAISEKIAKDWKCHDKDNLIKAIAKKIAKMAKPPEFDGGRIPVYIAAKIMKKNPRFLEDLIESGKLPIGCVERGTGGKKDTYISPKLFYEYTGHIFKSDEWNRKRRNATKIC